jgi:hypothetical protein
MDLYELLKSKKEKLSIIGLGYVGIVLAIEFAKKLDTIGFDINKNKIEKYLNGIDPTNEVGTRLNGEIVGKEADAVCYSFQAVKNLPTADSGMICFKKNEDDQLVRKLSWMGIDKDTYARDNGNYKWKYEVDYLGYKYNGNSIIQYVFMQLLKNPLKR